MLSILLTFACLTVVSGQATRCCMPTKWSSFLTDDRLVSQGNKISSEFFYDYDHKAIAMQFFRFGKKQVSTNLTRVVTKYTESVRYTIQPNGTCTKSDIKGEVMMPNCITDSATHLGYSYIGDETTGLKYDAWSFTLGNLNLTMMFTNPGCVPIIEGVVGSVTMGSVDTVCSFNGYVTGIKPAAFNVPPGC